MVEPIVEEEVIVVELDPEDSEAIRQRAIEFENQKNSVFDSLTKMVEEKFTDRKTWRATKEAQWITAESLYLGRLGGNVNDTKNPFHLDGDQNHQIPPDFNIVRTKVDNTVAALEASQFATGDKNWDLRPSPKSELCPEDAQLAAQQAQQRAQGAPVTEALYQSEVQRISADKCRAMSETIEDQLNQGNYGSEARKSMEDLVKLGTAVQKGPTNSARLRKSYTIERTADGKRIYIPILSYEPAPASWRVDPWLFFPDMTTNDPNRLKDSIEVHPYTRANLQDLRSNAGFFPEQIDKVLKEEPKDWISVFHDIRGAASLTSSTERLFKDKYLILEYHGPITKKDLDLAGIDYSCTCDGEGDSVFGEVWVVNGKVIRFAVHALDGQNEVPYAIDVFKKDPGSVFGFGLPDILEGQQRVINRLYFMALWNSGMSCAPMQIINKAILSPAGRGQGYDVAPGKTYLANEHSGDFDLSRAILFVDIPNATPELTQFMDYVRQLAEESSNMPAIMAGLSTPTGSESATGIAIQNQNATAPLFHQSQQWDDNITKKVIRWMYDWNMQFNEDDWIKGDYDIDVITTTQYINQQKARLDLQNLLMMAGQDPEVSIQIDRGDAVRALLATMKLPAGMVRSVEAVEAERQRMAQNQQPDPAAIKAQADMLNAENKTKELELKSQEVELQREEMQHRAQMEYATKLENYETREMEAQIRLQEKQMDLQIKYLELAVKDESSRASYVQKAEEIQAKAALEAVKLQGSMQQAQSKQALESAKLGVEAQLKATDQAIHQEEMELRRSTGSGV